MTIGHAVTAWLCHIKEKLMQQRHFFNLSLSLSPSLPPLLLSPSLCLPHPLFHSLPLFPSSLLRTRYYSLNRTNFSDNNQYRQCSRVPFSLHIETLGSCCHCSQYSRGDWAICDRSLGNRLHLHNGLAKKSQEATA